MLLAIKKARTCYVFMNNKVFKNWQKKGKERWGESPYGSYFTAIFCLCSITVVEGANCFLYVCF